MIGAAICTTKASGLTIRKTTQTLDFAEECVFVTQR